MLYTRALTSALLVASTELVEAMARQVTEPMPAAAAADCTKLL
jgi:hypothetical protein